MNAVCDFTGQGGKAALVHANMRGLAGRIQVQNMTEAQAIEMQFALYAEGLRRLCYWYLNRPVRLDKKVVDQNGESRVVYARLSQSEALVQFAKDLSIIPRLLHLGEVHEALVNIHQERQQKIQLFDSVESLFINFIIQCADRISNKLPFSSILSKLGRPQQVSRKQFFDEFLAPSGADISRPQVRAVLAFLQIQRHGLRHENSMLLRAIVQHRFPSVNAIQEEQEAAALRVAERQRRMHSAELTKVVHNLQLHWRCAHEVFLWFCRRPQPVALPTAARRGHLEPHLAPQQPTPRMPASAPAGRQPPPLLPPMPCPTTPTRAESASCKPVARVGAPLGPAAAARKIQAVWRARLRARRRQCPPAPAEARKAAILAAAASATTGGAHMSRPPPWYSGSGWAGTCRTDIPILKPLAELLAWKRDVIERVPPAPAGPAAGAAVEPRGLAARTHGSRSGSQSARLLNDRLGTWGAPADGPRTAAGLRPASARHSASGGGGGGGGGGCEARRGGSSLDTGAAARPSPPGPRRSFPPPGPAFHRGRRLFAADRRGDLEQEWTAAAGANSAEDFAGGATSRPLGQVSASSPGLASAGPLGTLRTATIM